MKPTFQSENVPMPTKDETADAALAALKCSIDTHFEVLKTQSGKKHPTEDELYLWIEIAYSRAIGHLPAGSPFAPVLKTVKDRFDSRPYDADAFPLLVTRRAP